MNISHRRGSLAIEFTVQTSFVMNLAKRPSHPECNFPDGKNYSWLSVSSGAFSFFMTFLDSTIITSSTGKFRK